jgi:hypothetical protein
VGGASREIAVQPSSDMASTQADDNLMAENGKQHKTSKSPVEKMRIRLAAEGYDKKYMPMDESDDEPSG